VGDEETKCALTDFEAENVVRADRFSSVLEEFLYMDRDGQAL
jgi:hypothetical protein